MSKSSRSVKVTLLYTEECSATPTTLNLIHRAAAETGVAVDVERILVESPAQATELRFLGSPTVQVNGLDIDPIALDRTDYGFM